MSDSAAGNLWPLEGPAAEGGLGRKIPLQLFLFQIGRRLGCAVENRVDSPGEQA